MVPRVVWALGVCPRHRRSVPCLCCMQYVRTAKAHLLVNTTAAASVGTAKTATERQHCRATKGKTCSSLNWEAEASRGRGQDTDHAVSRCHAILRRP